jgi:uncharacterized protein (DUF305 family)
MALRHWLRGPSMLALTAMLSGSPVSVARPLISQQAGCTPAPAGSGCMGQGRQRADQHFIEQMIPHHRMGVMMAAHARMRSQRSELRDLQAAMVRVQSEEIARMDRWFRRWYAPAGQ